MASYVQRPLKLCGPGALAPEQLADEMELCTPDLL